MIFPYLGSVWPDCTVVTIFIRGSINPSIEHALLNHFFGVVGILGLFLGVYIITTYRKKEIYNIFLGIFTLTVAMVLLELVLYWWNDVEYNPKVPFYKCLVFLWGPTLYLYFENKAGISSDNVSIGALFKHYSIFLFSLVLLLVIGNANLNTVFPESGISWAVIEFLTNTWVRALYCAFYIVLMVKQYLRDKKQLDRMGKTWTKALISFFTLIFLIVSFRAEFAGSETFDLMSKYLTAYSFSAFIIIMCFLNILFPGGSEAQMTNNTSEEKYKNSGLTEAMIMSLKQQLTTAMEGDKIFLNHKLTLQSLAITLNTDRYSLSQVINQVFNKNFYEFINDYRIKESIKIIETHSERVELVSDLIYESGFNNRVSFYKAFKKRKHMTPAKFIKEFRSPS